MRQVDHIWKSNLKTLRENIFKTYVLHDIIVFNYFTLELWKPNYLKGFWGVFSDV